MEREIEILNELARRAGEEPPYPDPLAELDKRLEALLKHGTWRFTYAGYFLGEYVVRLWRAGGRELLFVVGRAPTFTNALRAALDKAEGAG